MLQSMRRDSEREEVLIEHVYREFNGDADGTANETIDNYLASLHLSGVVIDEGWFHFDASRLT